MNSQLDEEYGAGFEGTKALLYKYIKDTPGQSIQQYMKTKSLSEILKKSDPVGDWIRDFIDSDNSRFAGKSKKERINMALGAYYAAQRNESIEEAVITDTVEEQTKTNGKKMSYTAQVRQANKEDRAKRAAAWRKVFSNLRKEEDEIELEEGTVSASQINRYIDTENWKAIADLMKGLTDDEHELWAKNGYDGRTYELLMKTRERSKSYKDAVEKMKNTLGVKESIELDEELKLFESENEEQLNEELFTTLAGYYLALKLLPLAAAALLIAAGGATAAIAYAIKGGIELKNAIERAKRDANASQESKDMIAKLEKFNERLKAQTKKNPKKVSLIKKAADALYNKVKKKTEAEIAAKKEKEKTATKKESTQIDEMRELYAVVDTTDGTVVATASSEDGAKRSIRSAHLPPISSPHPSKLKIVKTKKTAQVGYPIKEEISLETLRIMKIVSLATGSKDLDALYEYASTSPSYSSIVELKEAFNKYIQQA
jgi:hypothetical protein